MFFLEFFNFFFFWDNLSSGYSIALNGLFIEWEFRSFSLTFFLWFVTFSLLLFCYFYLLLLCNVFLCYLAFIFSPIAFLCYVTLLHYFVTFFVTLLCYITLLHFFLLFYFLYSLLKSCFVFPFKSWKICESLTNKNTLLPVSKWLQDNAAKTAY
jgi:hypothetical protein